MISSKFLALVFNRQWQHKCVGRGDKNKADKAGFYISAMLTASQWKLKNVPLDDRDNDKNIKSIYNQY